MDEAKRIERQRRYVSICRQQGWLSEDGHEVWPEDEADRVEMARGLFGLTLVSNTDSWFEDIRECLGASHLVAGSDVNAAIETLGTLNDAQRTALLTLLDDRLDLAVHSAMIRLDRFDHGHIKLQVLQSDPEECCPIPGSEIDIISDDHNELLQDALQWKDDFSLGTKIGRSEPYQDDD